MQDLIVTLIALVAVTLVVRGWLKRRAVAAPPKCANCAIATELTKEQKH